MKSPAKVRREYFKKASKLKEKPKEKPIEYPKINPANNKYRDVVKKAAQAYRALSADEKLERIRIAYKDR